MIDHIDYHAGLFEEFDMSLTSSGAYFKLVMFSVFCADIGSLKYDCSPVFILARLLGRTAWRSTSEMEQEMVPGCVNETNLCRLHSGYSVDRQIIVACCEVSVGALGNDTQLREKEPPRHLSRLKMFMLTRYSS